MFKIFSGFIEEMIENSGIAMDFAVNKLGEMVFNIENFIGNNTGIDLFNDIKSIFYALAIWLLILKFSKKGFETYIVGTEGDPDSDPFAFLFRFAKAIALMLCFPILYEVLARVTIGVGLVVLDTMQGSVDLDGGNILMSILSMNQGFISSVASAIGLILLYFQILMRGAEMYVMRIGFYLACVGLAESDNGSFAPFVMVFFKCAITTLVQVTLLQLSITLIQGGNTMIGLAFLFLAIGTPKFLDQFMVPTGGGNVMGKVYQGARLADIAMRIGK